MSAYSGANDFCFDTEVISNAAIVYREKAEELNNIKVELVEAISELKDYGWKSEAGNKFFSKVSGDWSADIQRYADLLTTLAECLENASGEFETVREEAVSLKIDTSNF